MNNLPLITQLLPAGLGGFIVGVLITLLLKRGNRKQQAELEQAKQALQDYREAVNRHFTDTADAVDELTRSYQKVFTQLSRGAEDLMTPEAYRSQLEQRSGHTITLSYLADADGGAADHRIQLVPHDAPVPPQNNLDEIDASADAAPVFNTATIEPAAPDTTDTDTAINVSAGAAADGTEAVQPATGPAQQA